VIHVIDTNNHVFYRDIIEDHFRIRHDIFVDERGWRNLYRPDGREIDQYDTRQTVYLLAIEDGRVIGGHRVLPTLGAHMLGEVFPHLVDGPVPSAPAILEWSRFFIVPERRGGVTFYKLMAAIQEYALLRMITHVTAVVEKPWLPKFDKAGFRYRPLGPMTVIAGVPTMAVQIDMRLESLLRVQSLGGLSGSVLAAHPKEKREAREPMLVDG